MKWLLLYIALVMSGMALSQSFSAYIIDKEDIGIPGVKVHNITQHKFARTDHDGSFSIEANSGDSLQFTLTGFDTLTTR